MFVGEPQPLVTAAVTTLEMRRASGLEIVEQRRITGAGGPRKQFLATRKIAFGNLDHTARQFLARTPGAIAAGCLANEPRRDNDLADRPDGEYQGDENAEQDRDGHLHKVAAEIDRNVTGILEQEMSGEREDQRCDDNDDTEFHCRFSASVRYCRSRRNDSEISGGETATMLSRISLIVCNAPSTWALLVSK
jgi:hypothetical protein